MHVLLQHSLASSVHVVHAVLVAFAVKPEPQVTASVVAPSPFLSPHVLAARRAGGEYI